MTYGVNESKREMEIESDTDKDGEGTVYFVPVFMSLRMCLFLLCLLFIVDCCTV